MNKISLDTRVALVLVLWYSISLFLIESWIGMAVACVMAIFFIWTLAADTHRIAVSLVPLYFILALTVVAHVPTGIGEGIFYALRIYLLAIVTLGVAFGFDDTQLVRAMTSLLSPLRMLHVPVDDIATMFSIALRFIPASMDEMKKVYTAQKSRAVAFDEGTIAQRVSKWGNVFIPVIVGLFRRAENLAEAMEARCYTGKKRTCLHVDELTASDWLYLVSGIAAIGTLALLF